jgi:hypothetical protein
VRNTRRSFFRSAALAAGIPAIAQMQREAAGNQHAGSPDPLVPTMRFGHFEISRLAVGCNPFYGYAHYNNILGSVMRDYYSQEKVCSVMHECNRYGINVCAYHHQGRAPQDLSRFLSEGGTMQLIVQCPDDPSAVHKAFAPMAIYHHGEYTDRAFQRKEMAPVKEWCKKVRNLGAMVGVGTHKPEVIAFIEEQGWDVDFYAGCVYNRTRTPEEWRQQLNGELPEMPGEIYLQSDPPRMYQVMRKTRRPCFAFKILAAGRIDGQGVEQAFRAAFESLKPNDGVIVGMFPLLKDEVRENAERVRRILTSA